MNIQPGHHNTLKKGPETAVPVMSELRVGIIGGLLAAIGAMSMALYTPAMTEIVQAFGTTEALVKLTLSVYFAGFCFAQLVCGPLSDGYGRRPVTIAFMGIYLIASVLALFSPNIHVLLAARFMQGVGAAVGVTVSRAIVRDLFTHEASARVMNLIGIVIALGPAISPTLGGLTMEYFGWHAIFLLMVCLGLLIVIVALFVIKETGTRDLSRLRPKEVIGSYRKLLTSRHFVYASLGVGGTTGALYTAATILPFILMGRVGMSATHFGVGLLLQTSCYLIGGLLFRRLMRLYSSQQLVMSGYIAITLSSLAIAILLRVFEPSYLLVMVPMGLFAFGIALIMPVMTSAGMAPFPKMAGAASAMMGFFQMGGGLVGGVIAAAMDDPVVAFASLIPIMGFVAAGAFLLWKRLPQFA
ncbi:multidrug effflux MFS transporter [Ochrobactrum sp. CM-21-5]|nr:multidrug effflux MFS transporter [Ochrobactrum sp. CM-21-5]MBC2886551.1 multidrug effflux MFS transporter [Ochrobactrum sp. CM-21-5]